MAYTNEQVPTLLDLANITDSDGKVQPVIEILNMTNEVLTDMSWMEGNLPTGHRTSIRTGLPKPTWRQLYGFVMPSKGTSAQVTEGCGMLEAFAEVDCALADLNGNTAAFRMSEDRAHIEAMGQEISDTIFHGDDESAAFIGMSPRYNTLTGADNSENVIQGNGAFGTQTDVAYNSAWLMVWGPNTIQGIVPKASKAGLSTMDLGKKLIYGTHDTSTNAEASPGRMMAYVTHYRWDAGLSVRDWRYAVRIANLRSGSVLGASGGLVSSTPEFTTMPELMHQAMDRIPNMNGGRAAWYMSRKCRVLLRQSLSRLHADSMLSMENIGGTMTESFMGVPIRRVDSLAATETVVT